MVTPVILTEPFDTIWYHGTNTTPFATWQCPPPSRGPADVRHSALFFASDQGFAGGAGSYVCTVKLNNNAKLIVPARTGAESTALRKAVLKSSPIAAHCQWLTNDEIWAAGWSTGEVMRFSYDSSNHKAVREISVALAGVVTQLKRMIKTPIPDDVLKEQAMMCLTRGWIEQVVSEAKKLGFQAIQGAEIDRWGGSKSMPRAQQWLAVMDSSVITAPDW